MMEWPRPKLIGADTLDAWSAANPPAFHPAFLTLHSNDGGPACILIYEVHT
jgi:hypothetical protein